MIYKRSFRKHQYENGIIFGHAKDGNLHFVITQSLSEEQDIEKYAGFIDDMVALVVHKYDGALKAETRNGTQYDSLRGDGMG